MHLVPAKCAQGVGFDVAELAHFQHERAHRFVIRCFQHDDSAVSAHRPVFLHDLHSQLCGLSHGGVAAFHCVFDIANALIFELNKTNLTSDKRARVCVWLLVFVQAWAETAL